MHSVTRVRIGNHKIFMGKGVRELLDAIDASQSIKEATKITGISYPKAMRMIKTLHEELQFDVVISSKGGQQHGGSIVTPKGKAMLEAYRQIEKDVEQYAQNLVDEHFPF